MGRDRQLSSLFFFLALHVLRCLTKVQFADLMRVRWSCPMVGRKLRGGHEGGNATCLLVYCLPYLPTYALRYACILHKVASSTQAVPQPTYEHPRAGGGHGQLITKSRFAWKGVGSFFFLLRRTRSVLSPPRLFFY